MTAPLGRQKIQEDVRRILDTPGSHFDMIQEGPFATVSKTWTTITDGVPQWIVVKSATTLRKFAREPHDIVKELRLLSFMTHPNIALVIGSFCDDAHNMLSIYMPFFPISLSALLSSPYFSPHPFPPHPLPSHSSSSSRSRSPSASSSDSNSNADADAESHAAHEERFSIIARSIMLQTLAALAFLHAEQRRIGHRDIKPENLMLTPDGCVKLIDFGVSWSETEPDAAKSHDLWPEYKGKLYFEVSTRAYRAPELLFGTRDYDHCAIDLWSIGATFAEFFTPLRLVSDDEDDGDDDDDTDPDADAGENAEATGPEPFIVPRYLRIGYPGAQWKRDTLFNGERGEIGLAWSIFKIFGTPTPENWPDFEELPGATSVVFNVVPAVPLRPLFPNLPPSLLSPMLESFDPDPDPNPNPNAHLNSSSSQSCPIPSLTPPHPPSSVASSTPQPVLPSPSPGPGPPLSQNSNPTSTTSSTTTPPTDHPLPPLIDLLSRFLTYPPAARLRAEDAMRHPWFTARGAMLLVPAGYAYALPWGAPLQSKSESGSEGKGEGEGRTAMHVWRGKTLGELVKGVLGGES